MTTKHTPGPWEWGKDFAGLYGPNSEPVLDFEPYEGMALCHWQDTGKANARLIAAAPTMLDFVAAKAAEGDAEAISILETIDAGR